jgi:hypothetical protein
MARNGDCVYMTRWCLLTCQCTRAPKHIITITNGKVGVCRGVWDTGASSVVSNGTLIGETTAETVHRLDDNIKMKLKVCRRLYIQNQTASQPRRQTNIAMFLIVCSVFEKLC